MKKEWQKPTLEVLDVKMTLQGGWLGSMDADYNAFANHHSGSGYTGPTP